MHVSAMPGVTAMLPVMKLMLDNRLDTPRTAE